MTSLRFSPRAVPLAAAILLLGLAGPAAALGDQGPDRDTGSTLAFAACGDGFECATLTVPLDYDHRSRGTLDLPVARRPATDPEHRIGTLFVNFGGPGDATAETLRAGGIGAFAGLNDRYDIVGWDPRGTGGTDAIDCKADPSKIGPYSQPFARPDGLDRSGLIARFEAYNDRCLALNPRILPFTTTGSTARDMNALRAALHEDKANYFGFSYGTFLGATYESLFPDRVGRFVLDGAVDPDQYINDPVQALRQQTKGFEVALGRFLQACARDQVTCLGFGADDPWATYDILVDSMNAAPLPGAPGDPRVVDGDDLLAGSLIVLYNKGNWPLLAQALAAASRGDGSIVQFLADAFYGRAPDGTFDPLTDRFFAITGTENRFPRDDLNQYFKIGADDFDLFDHAWWNSGYADLAQALWPVRPVGAFFGPFRGPEAAPTTLVVANTYDPATPYKGARRMVTQLGNARLLTMRGDGHTAYPGNSPCIDVAVEAYLKEGRVPPAGTVCVQDVPFVQSPEAAAAGTGSRAVRRALRRGMQPHTKPLASVAG
jgi:pimeloyl-ACP methyl ester carboxylesterase